MCKSSSWSSSTHTDGVAFSALLIAGLLMLGLGTWSPIAQVTDVTPMATSPSATKVAIEEPSRTTVSPSQARG